MVLPLPIWIWPFVASAASAPPPVIGGHDTTDWPATGVVLAVQASGDVVLCSGVLVADDAVLTAAHCAVVLQELMDIGLPGVVRFGASVHDPPIVDADVASVLVHPDWDPSGFEDDLALLAIFPVDAVTPVLFSPDDARPAWVGETLTGVGWGDADDAGGGAGVKRALALDVFAVDADFIRLEASGGANLCHGDSGGAIMRDVDGVASLAGVATFVYKLGGEDGCVGGAVAAVRADRAERWVDSVRAGEEWDGIWVSDGPSFVSHPPEGCAVTSGGRYRLWLAALAAGLGLTRRRG